MFSGSYCMINILAMKLTRLITHAPIIIFLLFYSFIISYKVISHPTPFYDWDESIYVQVGREMIQNKSLVPLWQGKEWLEKPPLVPFMYGLLQLLPIAPEISTRIFSLFLAITALGFVYAWIYKLFASNIGKLSSCMFATAVCALIAFNPLFIQKAQIVNTDVWLIIGFLGYLLVYPHFGWGLFFLFIGVFSKSLLGFYPAIMMATYTLYQHVINKKNVKEKTLKALKMISIQIGFLFLWYILMLLLYKNEFINVHFRDHLLRRVTQSVESKFGKRTFYFDLIIEYFGYFSLVTLFSLGTLLFKWMKKRISDEYLFKLLFLLPYFLFLNLTKTKIAWYVIPAIPQAALLIAYPTTLLKKVKPLVLIISLLIICAVTYKGIYKDKFFTSFYSEYDNYYRMSIYAKDNCSKLYVLLDGGSRNTHDTLQKLGLLLSTTEIYGNHPAVLYYFGKKTQYVFTVQDAQNILKNNKPGECMSVEKTDLTEITQNTAVQIRKNFTSIVLSE